MTTHSHPHWACFHIAAGQWAQAQAMEWWRTHGDTPSDARLHRDVHGKPVFAPPHARHAISWSHGGGVLLVACGMHMDVGVDVEAFQRPARALAIARRYFHPDEVAALAMHEGEAQRHLFLHLWCGKEAVLKADGRGIAFGLQRVRFAVDATDTTPRLVDLDPALGARDRWHLQWLTPTPTTLGALAWRRHARE